MNTDVESRILERKGVKPTSNRILVLRTLLASIQPISLPELEDAMPTMDKSSIFRVLILFVEHHIAHALEDGSGMLKYEICDGENQCTLNDMHTHFYCEACHQTFCFKTIHIPGIDLPEGFTMHSINYVVKGICPKCVKKPSLKSND